MEIILHLGAHRCASTTFQSFLWENRARLAKQGLTCWTPRRTRDGLMHGLMRHPALITIEDERNGMRSIGRIRVEVERLARADQRALLLSEENMLGTMRNNMLDTRLYSMARERLMRFRPAFVGHKLRIGVCVRSYEDYWTSCLAYLVARGGALPTVDMLDFLTTQPRRWRHVIHDIAQAFPGAEVIVWPFERLANQPAAQLKALWSSATDMPRDSGIWRNRSASLVRLNKIMALRGEHLIEPGPVDASRRWMPFDEDQCNVLRAEYRRDLAWLEDGAQGLARFVDGRTADPMGDTLNDTKTMTNHVSDGRSTPAPGLDRAEDLTRSAFEHALLFGGRKDGIEEGLGRTGAS